MSYQVTFTQYWNEVSDIADNILDEWLEEDEGFCIYDRLHEEIDGHQWIIYTAYHDDVLRHCGDEDAWEELYCAEDIGNLVKDQGMAGARMAQAFWAFNQDVGEALQSRADEKELDLC